MKTIWLSRGREVYSNNEWTLIAEPPPYSKSQPCDNIEMEAKAPWALPKSGWSWLVPRFDLKFGNGEEWIVFDGRLLEYGKQSLGIGLKKPVKIYLRIRMGGVPSPREFRVRLRGLVE